MSDGDARCIVAAASGGMAVGRQKNKNSENQKSLDVIDDFKKSENKKCKNVSYSQAPEVLESTLLQGEVTNINPCISDAGLLGNSSPSTLLEKLWWKRYCRSTKYAIFYIGIISSTSSDMYCYKMYRWKKIRNRFQK